MGPSVDRVFGRLRAVGFWPRAGSLALVAAFAGLLLVGDDGLAQEQEYSAYADPGKTALSFVLSDEKNVRSLQEEFDLDDGEVEKILAAVREENERLAVEYAESEKIVSSHGSLPDEEIADKISASNYDETVEEAVDETEESVVDLLPGGNEAGLKSWVDEQWRREAGAALEERSGKVVETKAGTRALRCKVFATQYWGHTRYEAALPHRKLKFDRRPRVPIRRAKAGSDFVRPRIKEVGPWNTYDNYWRRGKYRTMWRDLPRCKPEAQVAYFRNYNRGRDEYGRKVLNPAGADLTPAVARRMGLKKYQNSWVYVRFPWVPR